MSAKDRVLWTALLLGSVLSLATAYGVATRRVIVGSVEGRWISPYVMAFDPRTLWVALLVSALAAALLWLPDWALGRREWAVVALWIVAAVALQACLHSLSPFSFARIFASDDANSFYSVTRRYDAGSVLADFAHLRAYWPIHAHSNMPGKLLLTYGLEWISTRPDVLAWLVVALSNLGGALLYLFVRDFFADRLAALFALVLYLFMPARFVFLPLLNTVTPVVVLGCVYVLLRGLQTGRAWWAAGLGAGLYGLVLFEPSGLAIGLLFAALVFRSIWLAEITWRTVIRQSGVTLLTFGMTYLAMRVCFQFDLFAALRLVGGDALGFNVAAGRTDAIWVRQNVLDFLFGVGVCQAFVFWVVLGASLRGQDSWPRTLARPIATLGLAAAGTLLILDVLDVNRGEVIRLWIFLACLFQIPAAYACARLQSRPALMLVLATTLLQDALASTIGFIIP